jgi:HSP20 family molecular chaperone IbpA
MEEESTKGVVMTPVLEDPVQSHGYPCAELHKTDERFEIDVETPGCEPEDLEVEVDGHKVTVLGAPSDPHPHPFTFIFELPGDVNLDRLHAAFEGGVLRVDAPRLARSAKRTLEIETPR